MLKTIGKKKVLVITDEGRRLSGVEQFYDELPTHIIPIQKSIPPYMPYVEGHGYQGVLLLDTRKDRVQCHICGLWYKALGKHLSIHDLRAEEYKDEVGMFRKEPLMSLNTLQKFKETWSELSKNNLNRTGSRYKVGHSKPAEQNGSEKIAWKNKYGTRDAQLKFRLEKAIEKHGRIPYRLEEKLLVTTFERRYGSWRAGLEVYGYSPNKHRRKRDYDWEKLNTPLCKICKVELPRKRYKRHLMDLKKWKNQKTCLACKGKWAKLTKTVYESCLVKGCKNPYKGKGMCMSHYMKKYRNEKLSKTKQKKK